MTPKMPSVNLGTSDEHPMAAAETGAASGDARDGGNEDVKAPGESYEDSLEAILLQASVVPPPASLGGSKPLGAKTLMGIGIEGLDLSALRAAHARSQLGSKIGSPSKDEADGKTPITDLHQAQQAEQAEQAEHLKQLKISVAAASETRGGGKRVDVAAPAASDATDQDDAGSRAIPGPHATPAQARQEPQAQREQQRSRSEGPRGTTLIDDVAQALNLQASEYRDRARGRLPGMPTTTAQLAGPAGSSSEASERTGAEFEGPDDGPTALTPGVIPDADERDEGSLPHPDLSLGAGAGTQGLGDGVVMAQSWQAGNKPDSRPMGLPRISGAPVGSVPASAGSAARTGTPPAGQPAPVSGSVRLPTPTPGQSLPTLPAPTGGRSPFQSGMPTSIAVTRTDSELTATAPSTPISLEASRRVIANNMSASASATRVKSRSAGNVTEPMIRSVSTMPFLLRAHIKIATVSLAGLIAVTFAGGLLVGMLVWKGQGRVESAATPRAVAPIRAAALAVQPVLPAEPQRTALVAGNSATRPRADEGPSIPGPVGSMVPQAEGKVENKVENKIQGVMQAPQAPEAEPEPSTVAAAPNRKAGATSRGSGARGSASASPSNDTAVPTSKTASAKATTRPAASPGSKPIANNAGGKAAAKSKTKPAWHDPFAD